jgi:hypothetical protein
MERYIYKLAEYVVYALSFKITLDIFNAMH